MTPMETASRAVSYEDLRSLASAQPPCITAVLTIPDPVQLSAHIGNTVRDVEKQLKNAGIDDTTAANLVEPLRAMAAATEQEGDWSVAFALFRSPEIFRYFLLRDLATEFVMVADRFQIPAPAAPVQPRSAVLPAGLGSETRSTLPLHKPERRRTAVAQVGAGESARLVE
jgi:hypothetical protein